PPTEPSNVVSWRSPEANLATTQHLGMVLFLCAWAMLFCGLLMTYGVVGASAHPWLVPGAPRPQVGLGALATAVVLAASMSVAFGQRALRAGRRHRATQALILAFALGAMFLA